RAGAAASGRLADARAGRPVTADHLRQRWLARPGARRGGDGGLARANRAGRIALARGVRSELAAAEVLAPVAGRGAGVADARAAGGGRLRNPPRARAARDGQGVDARRVAGRATGMARAGGAEFGRQGDGVALRDEERRGVALRPPAGRRPAEGALP